MHTTTSGLQLTAVQGWHGELLPLATPLSLGKRSPPKWLNALEGVLSHSLSLALTDCITNIPDSLMGVGQSSKINYLWLLFIYKSHANVFHNWFIADSAVPIWIKNNLSQCVQLSLELSWTHVLHSSLCAEKPIKDLKLSRYVYNIFKLQDMSI